MRILLLTQWFQPEPQFKGLPLAKALVAMGHEVEVLTGFPNYPGGKLYPGYSVKACQKETMDGIRVTRGALYPSHDRSAVKRIVNYASFAVSSALLALTLRRPDVIYVYCPPMTAAAGAMLLRLLRRVPYVIDIQDLWPDTLASTGMVNNKWIFKLVGAWSALAMRHASALVVLSPGFKKRLEERKVTPPIHVIPNWAPPEIVTQAQALQSRRVIDRPTLNILFAGNMGKAQALEIVIEAARKLKQQSRPVRFTMIGSGVEVDDLQRKSQLAETDNIEFLPARPASEMEPVFSEADALLVHLRNDPLFSITIPSKTQAYLVMGLPILMGVRGDAADVIETAKAGILFTPEDVGSLVEAVIKLSDMSPEQRQSIGQNGRRFYEENLAIDKGIALLEKVLVNAPMQSGA